jgi:hypothetical protein
MRYIKIIPFCLFAAALLLPSCKESPKVYPYDVFMSATGNNSGYWYPIATVLPANGTTGVPVNSISVIIFNMSVDPTTISPGVTIYSTVVGGYLTEGPANDYEISMNAENTIATITFHYGGVNPLLPSDTVDIELLSTIRDLENNVPLNNPGIWQFTTGTAPDITPPAIIGGTNNPTGGGIELTNVARLANGHEIHIDFSKTIDPNSVSLSTFSLTSPGPSYIAATYTFNPTYTRAILTPVDDLIYNTTYTVTLTTGIKDLSGNNLLAGTSWTFTTVTTPPDPFGGLPTITGPQVDLVRTNDALISWYYNKPANYTLYYGRGSGVGDMSSTLSDTYSTFQTADLTGLLLTNRRYWFYINYADVVGNSGSTGSGSPYQLNTESGEAPTSINNGPGHQHSANKLIYHPVNGNPTGFFLFWSFNSGGNNQIYSRLYDNAPAPLWASTPVFANGTYNYTYTNSVEDNIGGAILIALRNDGLYFAKRLNNSGAIMWGDNSTSTGVQLSAAAISSVSAVPVYNRITQTITSGTTEMASLGLSNYFFDDDVNLSSVKQGDIIIDPVNHGGTTAVKTGQDFVYVLGQAASVISPARTYYIGDATTSNSIDVHNHQLANTNDAPQTPPPQYNYTSGGTTFYTDHGWTPPSAPAWMGAGDIVLRNNNSTYGRLSSMTQLTPITYIYTGLADGLDNTHLYDWTYQFLNTSDNDYVVNDTKNAFSTRIARTWYEVSPGVYWWTLTLNAPGANFSAGDTYHIYDLYCNTHITQINQFNSFYQFVVDWAIGITSGLAATTIYNYTGPTGTAQTIPTNPLCDNEGSFNGTVLDGDIVVNTTTGNAAVVNSIATYNYIHALGLNYNIMNDNNSYNIIRYRYTPVVSGRTDGAGPNIQDSVTDFNLASVAAGDIAYNPVTDQYSLITSVAQHVLTLKTDIGIANNVYYAVFRQAVLYVWQEGTNLMGRIMSMEGSPPAQLRAPWIIVAGTNPHVIPDGSGNAIVVFNTPSGQVWALRLNGYGDWIRYDQVDATASTILDIKGDNAGNAVILYKYGNNDLHIQKIDSSGFLLWGAGGLSIVIGATASTQETMEYIAPNDVIVAANISNNTYIWRRGVGGANDWARNISVGTAYNPQVYYNSGGGGTVIALWQDTRFHNPPATYINTGYGVFGLKMNYSNGNIAAGWTANGTGAADNNGVSIILNRNSYLLPNPLVVPYNDGGNSLLIWEDYRQGRDNDLVYYRLDNFTP